MRNTTAICWVRNEEDIVEAFVRHTLSMVDHMVLVLHRSDDCTQEILKELVTEGLSLEIRHNSSLVHEQSAVLTALMHEVAQESKWILPLDADEFLVTAKRMPFVEAIEKLPQEGVSLLLWHTYVPLPEDDHDQMNVLMRMQHKRSYEQQPFSKVIIPAHLIRNSKEALLPEGSHELILEKRVSKLECPTLHLGHFPVRSAGQFKQKIVRGWESHRANPQRKPGQAFHWEALYERCKSPAPLSDEDLRSIALHYAVPEHICLSKPPKIVRDPIAFASQEPLRYTPTLAALPL